MAPKAKKEASKKNGDSVVANPKNVTARDLHQRMSYLYQASALLAKAQKNAHKRRQDFLPTERPATDAPVASSSRVTLDTAPALRDSFDRIASSVTASMRNVAQKAVLRLDYKVKRSICKGCGVVLLPGVTSKVRTKPSKNHLHLLGTTCLGCNHRYTLPQAPEKGGPPDKLRRNARERRHAAVSERIGRKALYSDRPLHITQKDGTVAQVVPQTFTHGCTQAIASND